MSRRIARSLFLVLVPFFLASCGPGTPGPQGGVTRSAISFGGETFQVPPGSAVGCQVAFCMEGVGCHACTAPTGQCSAFVGCTAPGVAGMGPGEVCSQDGCIPSACVPAYCTAAGQCMVCDDGDPATEDQCFGDPASPCRHVPMDGPDAVTEPDVAVLPDAGTPDAGPPVEPGVDVTPGTDLPGTPDAGPMPDESPAVDATPSEDAAAPDAPVPGDPCIEVCERECEGDDDGVCKKDKHSGEHHLLPPGWRKGRHLRCDNGKHLGFERGHHAGWLKEHFRFSYGSGHGDGDDGDDDEDGDDDSQSCEVTCLKVCGGGEVEHDDDGDDEEGDDEDREE